jgi:hypothetical protein
MRAPFQEGDFPGPVKYGYLGVGTVEQGPAGLLGRRLFCLYPHQTAYVVPIRAVAVVPDDVSPSRAVLRDPAGALPHHHLQRGLGHVQRDGSRSHDGRPQLSRRGVRARPAPARRDVRRRRQNSNSAASASTRSGRRNRSTPSISGQFRLVPHAMSITVSPVRRPSACTAAWRWPRWGYPCAG